jgi:hypothetical protein
MFSLYILLVIEPALRHRSNNLSRKKHINIQAFRMRFLRTKILIINKKILCVYLIKKIENYLCQ